MLGNTQNKVKNEVTVMGCNHSFRNANIGEVKFHCSLRANIDTAKSQCLVKKLISLYVREFRILLVSKVFLVLHAKIRTRPCAPLESIYMFEALIASKNARFPGIPTRKFPF